MCVCATYFILYSSFSIAFFFSLSLSVSAHVNEQNENEQNTDDSRTKVSKLKILYANICGSKWSNKTNEKRNTLQITENSVIKEPQPHKFIFYSTNATHSLHPANKFIQHYNIIIQFQFALLSSHSSQNYSNNNNNKNSQVQ